MGQRARDGFHELPGVGVLRPDEDLFHRPLLDDLSAAHHRDAVRDPPDDRKVTSLKVRRIVRNTGPTDSARP